MEEKFDLEESFRILDKKVTELENPDVGLEDSFRVYKEGMDLIRKCSEAIQDVEKKVLVLEEGGGIHEFQRQSGN